MDILSKILVIFGLSMSGIIFGLSMSGIIFLAIGFPNPTSVAIFWQLLGFNGMIYLASIAAALNK